jgi:hypothetical protein
MLKTFDFLVQGRIAKSPLPIDAIKQLAAPHTMTPKEKENVDAYPYRQIIGALLHVAMYTKPEMSYAVEVLSRYQNLCIMKDSDSFATLSPRAL